MIFFINIFSAEKNKGWNCMVVLGTLLLLLIVGEINSQLPVKFHPPPHPAVGISQLMNYELGQRVCPLDRYSIHCIII